MKAYFDYLGCLGIERMVALPCDMFYWVNMQRDAEEHAWKYDRCLWFKARAHREGLHPILAMYLLELVNMDYLIIENPKCDEDINVLVITYHFTRYTQAIMTSSQTAKATSQALWNHFVVHYSLPTSLISEQLCEIAQVEN